MEEERLSVSEVKGEQTQMHLTKHLFAAPGGEVAADLFHFWTVMTSQTQQDAFTLRCFLQVTSKLSGLLENVPFQKRCNWQLLACQQ